VPDIKGLLETALYVEDVGRSVAFYTEVLPFKPMLVTPRLAALDAGRQGVLLLFRNGATSEDLPTDSGLIPGHEGQGRLHLAFAIERGDYAPWKQRLEAAGIAIVSEVTWTPGGRSLYFHDPDGHVVELATPGIWANY
jgi:catechol 2,3-dioxygenase-like lactoylglutathione lyase family enzyme